MASELPPCGLYKTGVSLPGHEEDVPAGRLIYFHNHSEKGPPLVLNPQSNTHNRWLFQGQGWLVEDPGFIGALEPLLSEGLYTVSGQHLHISRDEIVPERSLVQLGYNRSADTILFVGKFEENTISFPSTGYRFTSADVHQHLKAVEFNIPKPLSDKTQLH